MSAAARRVRQLRLRADSAQAVRRVLPGLEDALRTATLPDRGGRLLLVRRLALGRIAADAAPASLALALERAVAAARIDCLPATAPGAGAAAAVWFRDPLDAHLALALRVLEGPPPREWFWPLALPAWSPGLDPAAAIAVLAASLDALPEAAVARPAWVAALVGRGHRARLAAVLTAAEREALPAPDAGGPAAALPPVAGRPAAAARAALAGRPPVDETPVRSLPPMTAAAQALEPMRRAAEAAPPVAVPRNRAVPPPAAAAAPVDASLQAPAAEAGPAAPALRTAVASAPVTAGVERADADAARVRPQGSPRPDRPPAAVATAKPAAVDTNTEAAIDGLPTVAGGLAFVLPVLARLGYPQWLDAHPERDGARIARRVLGLLLARLRVAADDPAWALAGSGEGDGGPAARCTLPACWSALALRHDRRPMVLAADAAASDQQLAALWARAVHRWLRLHARIGLADLVLRPALLQLTPTHVDVRHDLRRVELRIRRAGLDLDPGWLPWFGRVVGFHYARLE